MRKQILFLLCLVFLFPPLIQAKTTQDRGGSLVVMGKLKNAGGKKLTLVNADNDKKADKAKIKADGTFVLNATLENSPTIFALQCEDEDIPLLLVGESGDTLRLNGQIKDFPLADVTGNQQSREMQQYQKEFVPFIRKAHRINLKASSLSFRNDSEAVSKLQEEAAQLNSDMQSTGMAFIQYHPKALASIFVLMNERRTVHPSKLKDLFSSLSEEVKDSRYGKMAGTAIKTALATAIGATAPNFTEKNTDDKPVSLSSFRGKYVLVDFWASWCGPCRRENPNVVKAYNRYKDENFTIVGVSLDKERDRWIDAIQQDKLFWTQVSDLKGWNNDAAQLYNVHSIPANFLIDPSGKIIGKSLRGKELEEKLASIFGR